jgi:hypothetical protein
MIAGIWTAEEKAYLAEIVTGRSYREITKLMNERFARVFGLKQVVSAIKRYELNTGRTGRFKTGVSPHNKGKTWSEYMPLESQERSRMTCFKPGRASRNKHPIGAEVWKDEYLWRKIAETKPSRFGWKQVHLILWEEAYGPAPAGHTVIFKDGNRSNIVLDNLMLISRAQLGVMNMRGWGGSAESGALLADLIMATTRREKE